MMKNGFDSKPVSSEYASLALSKNQINLKRTKFFLESQKSKTPQRM